MREYKVWILTLMAILIACQGTGVNPTGLTGAQVMCPLGPRPSLDCRGVLQQYARDLKADLNYMSQVQIGLGITSTKLTEADALTSDLLQHYYQTCTLYNACIIAPQDYAAKTDRLQDIQLQVRRALVAAGFGGQQNIQINPPFGAPFPPPQPGAFTPPGGFPPGGGIPPGGFPPGAPPAGFPQPSPIPPGDPGLQQPSLGFPSPGQPIPGQVLPGSGINPSIGIPPGQGAQTRGDTVLNILREGSKLLREATPAGTTPVAPPPAPAAGPMSSGAPQEDLDTSLRAMLFSLKQEIARQNPAQASGRAVVGNFTEEGQPWSSPLGALLRERVSSLVETEGLFKAPAQTRGITVKEVAAVANPNDPKALSSLYNTDLAISGTYRPQADRIQVRLAALDDKGAMLAQANREISPQAIPSVVAAVPQNSAEANQFLNSLNQLGPKSQGNAKVEVTTNRPGAGANFRLGEEIKYFVSSTIGGYLYLFHVDADKNTLRLFPNQYQKEARIATGATIEFPSSGAPFKFEASPPFGLETTFALVTPVPLDEKDFQMIEGAFAKPRQDVPTLVATRGISVKPTATAPPHQSGSTGLVWNSVTVLIRP